MAKELVRHHSEHGASRRNWGLVLTYWGTFTGWVGLGYGTSGPHPYISSALYAVAILQISLGFWMWSKWRRLLRAIPALGVILTFGFIDYQWLGHLHAHRHTLSSKERVAFETPLKAKKDTTLNIQIACPYADERPCLFASQFVSMFGESGWRVDPTVQRLMLSQAKQGVVIYRRGGNKDYMQKHWDAGAYFAINEPHLLAVQSAFQSVKIEPCGATNPDLAEDVMMIYFGAEREDESQPTALTKSREWVDGKVQGPYPINQGESC